MGTTDKITGRLKQAAGDVLGDEDLRREGVTEERKGEAKRDLERMRERYKDAVAEVDQLETRSDAERLARTRTHHELYEEAALLGIEGRSEMSDDDLAEAIMKARR